MNELSLFSGVGGGILDISSDSQNERDQRPCEFTGDVAQRELPEAEQVGGPLNCTSSELSIYLQALEEGYLATSSLGTTPSALSKSTPIASASYTLGKETVFFLGFPSLEMFAISTGAHGAGELMSLKEASRARTSAQPGKVPESTVKNQGSGEKWQGSFARFDRVSSSWRIPQCFFPADFGAFSETWPKWGMMRDGECWELKTPSGLLEIRSWITSESASGFWRRMPTPRANDAEKRGEFDLTNPRDGLPAAVKAMRLPTPTSSMVTIQDMEQAAFAGNDPKRPKYSECLRLQTLVADDAAARKEGKVNSRGEPKLSAQVKRMPTPVAKGSLDGGSHSRQAAKERGAWIESGPGGQLNPNWEEWLMGWPIGWSALEPLGIHRYPEWRRSHGSF